MSPTLVNTSRNDMIFGFTSSAAILLPLISVAERVLFAPTLSSFPLFLSSYLPQKNDQGSKSVADYTDSPKYKYHREDSCIGIHCCDFAKSNCRNGDDCHV